MTRARVFVLLIVTISSVHFVAWYSALSWVLAHEQFIVGPGMASAACCGYETGTPHDDTALVATVVLSLPLVIWFGCVLWYVSPSLVILLGIVNSAIWGVGLASLLLAAENSLWKRMQQSVVMEPHHESES